jgi:diguanylate cyclase (GGDEF)-like protein
MKTILPAAPPNDELLLRARFKLLVENLPKLYLTVIVVVCFVSMVISDAVSPKIVAPWAAFLIIVAAVRALHWRRLGRNGYDFPPEEMSRRLIEIGRIGVMLLGFFTSIGFFVLQSPDVLLRTTTILALWAAGVGTSFYLFMLPETARNCVLGVSAVVVSVFLWSGGKTLLMATPVFVAVSLAQLVFLRRTYETFKTAVQAQSAVESLRREALQLAMTDALTELPNRRAFEAHLNLLATAGEPFALAIIDLDGFKPVNDTYGHAAGDEALIIVAHRLRSLGGEAFVARLGGDEFSLLTQDVAGAESLLCRAVELLSAPYLLKRGTVRMSASSGLAFWRRAGDEARLLENADAALYTAKQRSQSGGVDRPPQSRVTIFRDAA